MALHSAPEEPDPSCEQLPGRPLSKRARAEHSATPQSCSSSHLGYVGAIMGVPLGSTSAECAAHKASHERAHFQLRWEAISTMAATSSMLVMSNGAAQTQPKKRPHYNNERRMAKAAANLNRRVGGCYAANGADRTRIMKILQADSCGCSKQCGRQFKFEAVHSFLQEFWKHPKQVQDATLMTCGVVSEEQCGRRRDYSFLGTPIGEACLCQLLGIGEKRLYKCFNGTPDLRFGKKDSRKLTDKVSTVDSYFSNLYMSVAQSMPTECPG